MSNPVSFGPDFQVISKLGEGSFAEVFKVRSNQTGTYYAIKRLKKRYRTVDEVNKMPEIYALKVLQGHPNVIKLEDIIYGNKSGYVSMVFEIMDCNLYEFISSHKKAFDEKTTLVLIYQLLKTIDYMHTSKKMFHRDIKPENCMVDKKTFTLKLCDFGSTRGFNSSQSVYNQPFTEYVSTRWYRAPECILTSGSYGPEVDEWAVGCMLYELMTTKPLFPGKHEIDQIARIHKVLGSPSRNVLAQFKRNPNTQISFAFPSQKSTDLRNLLPRASPETIELLTKLLIYDPCQRITAGDALNLPAFESIRRFEENWENGSKNVPFALAYLQSQSQPSIQPNRFEVQKPHQIQPLNAKQQIALLKQQQQQNSSTLSDSSSSTTDIKNNNINSQYTTEYAPVIPPYQKKNQIQYSQQPMNQYPTSNNPFINQQLPQYHHHQQPALIQQPQISVTKPLISKKPNESNLLAESRKKAAMRIAQYNQKKLANIGLNAQMQQAQLRAKKAQPFHGPSFQFAEAKIANGGFQKPRPDIVQPRLPKIIL
ncbi:hypothetical protein M9Y10_045454 [Tritrichomonas musculus]|uniref:Protein kinase domain-containing protein n=1 Tax=Tritrichomonas musculus TaxID=1915356 RepID=A0ABR2GLV7_9EUKA